jgi:hypothetical protein
MSLEAREVAGVWGTVQAALKYFVLDCRCRLCQDVLLALAFSMRMTPSRSRAEFSNGRLPTAMLMDVDAFRCLRLPRLDSPAAAPPTAAVSLSLALSRIPFVCFFFPQSRRSTRRPQGRSRVHAACARHCAGCDAPSNCRLPERRASTPAHLYLPFYPCLPLPSLLPLPTSTFPSTPAYLYLPFYPYPPLPSLLPPRPHRSELLHSYAHTHCLPCVCQSCATSTSPSWAAATTTPTPQA